MERPAHEPAGRQGCGAAEVTLSVYDVSRDGRVRLLNGLLRPLGGGAFHAGVVVHGREWSFGLLQETGTGVFDCQPQANPYHQFREAVTLGATSLPQSEVAEAIRLLKAQWPGSSYDLTARNCCHFCASLAKLLGVRPPPAWVARLASSSAPALRGLQAVGEAAQLVQGSWNSVVVTLECVRAEGIDLAAVPLRERCVLLRIPDGGQQAVGPKQQPAVGRLAPWAAKAAGFEADHLFTVAWDSPCLFVKRPPSGASLKVNGTGMKYETFVLLNKSEIGFYDSTCEGGASRKPRLAFRVLRDAGATQLQWALETIRYQSTRLPSSPLAYKIDSRSTETAPPPARRAEERLAGARAVDTHEGEFRPL